MKLTIKEWKLAKKMLRDYYYNFESKLLLEDATLKDATLGVIEAIRETGGQWTKRDYFGEDKDDEQEIIESPETRVERVFLNVDGNEIFFIFKNLTGSWDVHYCWRKNERSGK